MSKHNSLLPLNERTMARYEDIYLGKRACQSDFLHYKYDIDSSEINMQPKLSIVTWYKIAFLNGLDFKGRASRREFWNFVLVNFSVGIVLGVLEGIGRGSTLTTLAGTLALVFNIVTYIPSLALTVRRVHDTNHSAWWVFGPAVGALIMIPFAVIGSAVHASNGFALILVPVAIAMMVCSIAVLIFCFMQGTPTDNDYGAVAYYDEQGNRIAVTPAISEKEYGYIKRDAE